ncbi:ATPase involved in chromosome partitioning [Puniceibacterium sp. IMCC21224]|nr:ATPase involved in chromosome partitioning [Puniceibacterium sp. IMCC21224]
MAERRKFHRRHGPTQDATGTQPAEDLAPISPLETRAERQARRTAERIRANAAQSIVEEQTQRRADAQAKAQAPRAAAAAQAVLRAEETQASERLKREATERAEAERVTRDEAVRVKAERLKQLASERRAHMVAEASRKRVEVAPPDPGAPQSGTLIRPHDPAPVPVDTWARMREFPINEQLLERNRIVTAHRDDPAHASFDVLRTRLLQALAQNGWKRVAITSPTKDCGKTFTAANLAISLSRQENCRTLLLDMDLRNPSMHKIFGVKSPGSIGALLRAETNAAAHLQRPARNTIHAGRSIAFAFNDTAEPYASELLQDPQSTQALHDLETQLAPDVVLFDLPPALYYDDVIAFRPQYDGVLLVVGGGMTTQDEIKEVERRLGKDTPLLGVVLNKAEGANPRKYSY